MRREDVTGGPGGVEPSRRAKPCRAWAGRYAPPMLASPAGSKSLVTLLGLALLALGGCGRKSETPSASLPAAVIKNGEPASAPVKSAELNSFDEVAAKLDHGGSLYFYLSTEQWLAGLSENIASLSTLAMPAATAGQSAEEREKMQRALRMVTDLVKRSGLEAVSGIGASSLAVEPGVYRNTLFVHHKKGDGGFLWTLLGGGAHRLTALDLLPRDTALASFTDLDVAQFLRVAREEIERAGIPEAKQGLDQALAQLSQMAGMPVDDVLQSLGGAAGLVLTLDAAKPLKVPIAGREESLPTPRLAVLLQVKDDRIFQQLDKALAANKEVVRVDEGDLRMRTLVIPALPQMEVRATVAQWGGWLALASDDRLIRDMIAAQKGGGLKATPEFAKLAAGLPEEGNAFQLATQGFAETWNRIQAEMMKNQPGLPPEQTALMEKLLSFQKAGATYSVGAQLENGWLTVGKGTKGAGQVMAPLLIVPVAIAAGVALPAFSKVQESAKATNSRSNAKQIAVACKLYALDNGGKFPPTLQALLPDYLPDAKIFVSPFAPEVPVGYTYTAGLTEKSPAATVLLEDKFAAREHLRVIVHVDCSGEIQPAP